MTLKAITMNGHHKRILPTFELVEAVTTTLRAVAASSQRATVMATVLPSRSASIRLAPHFTCSAEKLVAIQYKLAGSRVYNKSRGRLFREQSTRKVENLRGNMRSPEGDELMMPK